MKSDLKVKIRTGIELGLIALILFVFVFKAAEQKRLDEKWAPVIHDITYTYEYIEDDEILYLYHMIHSYNQEWDPVYAIAYSYYFTKNFKYLKSGTHYNYGYTSFIIEKVNGQVKSVRPAKRKMWFMNRETAINGYISFVETFYAYADDHTRAIKFPTRLTKDHEYEIAYAQNFLELLGGWGVYVNFESYLESIEIVKDYLENYRVPR